ncbi:Hypothetical predicted protein [Cloeon dipterum]|uniref:F-actin monooxygenase n=1 Tax=Cloeon dipterum TaxID=197152 RepID=A0A8S1CY92_9INSE|nr:Hypothetical predicted protein [Cloeon dipterum]
MPLRLETKRKLIARSDRVKNVDLHPQEPWLLVSLYNGNVHVWNHESQQMVKTIEVCDLPVRAAKFVARKNWIVTGSDDMSLRVFNYNTLEKVQEVEAHSDYVRCIAVHPTQPYLLTSSDDMLIKLWHWDRWACQQVFEGHTHYVMQVVFNPKDNNTFASASLDRTVKVWQLGSSTPNFTLEGHEKGVNCIDFCHAGDKPYLVSGADDRLAKVWDYQNKTCVQTLEGHAQNISAVCFHPELPVLLTGSEDGTVRVWHAATYRLETSLNYGLERVWTITCLRGSNDVALGYDEGSVLVKIGREEPAVSMDTSGKIIWARHSELQQSMVKACGEGVADGERLSLAAKEMGACEIYPQSIAHNPNGRFVVVCGDGEYIIYTAMALRNKAFGTAQEFVWAHDSSEYAVREGVSTVKVFKNFKERKSFKPEGGAEGIFGGFVLGVRSASSLSFFEWETLRLIRRIEIQPRHVFWSETGELLCIATEDSYFVLKYNADAVTDAADRTEDGVEDAFDVVGEVAEAVKTGLWVGDCFIYTNGVNRVNYYVGGEIVTVAHLDRPAYLLGYLPKDNRLYLADKELNVISYSLLLSVLEYQTAVMRKDMVTADRVLPTVPKEQRTRVAHFLEKQGFKKQALAVSTDPEHRFDLALQLSDLETALSLARDTQSAHKWRQLADAALAAGKIALANECLEEAKDFGGLLLLASSSGDVGQLERLAAMAAEAEKHNIAFSCNFLLGRLDECLQVLISTQRLPEAAFFARTYLPSQVSRVVKLWKEALSKVSEKAGQALADPEEYNNLFPGMADALKTEQFLKQQPLLPAAAYTSLKPNIERSAVEEMRTAEASGSFHYSPPQLQEKEDEEEEEGFADAAEDLAKLSINSPPAPSAPAAVQPILQPMPAQPPVQLQWPIVDDDLGDEEIDLDDPEVEWSSELLFSPRSAAELPTGKANSSRLHGRIVAGGRNGAQVVAGRGAGVGRVRPVLLGVDAQDGPDAAPAPALWAKFDKRVAHKCYARGTASEGTRVLIIGAGPCGLRAAIEAQLLGAKVVVLEKRDRISRNNVLHLWPFVIHDLRSLGAKKFFGKFCAGAIDHISIRQLQVILLKVALLLGVELHVGVSFESLVPPVDSSFGWRAETSPEDHPASQFEFNCLIGADGKRNTLEGFGRKEFRGKLAIAITANFINKRSEAEARVEEISGVAFIFNQKFFRDLYEATGIDLENIVYYKDDTHYFVMTAKKNSLIDKGVIISDQPDTARLLHPDNVDKEALMEYAREAADFSTQYQLPHLEFAVNHYGQPDVAMFDFTSMYAAENASRVVERHGHRLLMQLVGDSLLEPFWPTGSGCARGFLSSLDACWAVRSWGSGVATPLEVVAERESIYRLLGQTTPENLNKDFNAYTLEPQTRYPNLNIRAVLPAQVRNLLTTDNPAGVELCSSVQPVKKRRREVEVASAVLVSWLKRQTAVYDDVQVGDDLAACFSDGRALCALVHRYRPQLVDLAALRADESVLNLQLAFNVLEKEAQIKPIIKAEEWASGENSDAIITYLGQVYDAFRGEIPHIKHAKSAIEEIEEILVAPRKSIGKSPKKRASLEREPKRQMRKRKSHDADRENRFMSEIAKRSGQPDEKFSGRIKELEAKFKDGNAVCEKKPKDLRRAIGRIDKNDWNIVEIEKKMEENRMAKGKTHGGEKVPKWNHDKFLDKISMMQSKLKGRSKEDEAAKFREIDSTLKKLDRQMREGSVLDPSGPRGSNKVSAMAEQLAKKQEPSEALPLQKSGSKSAFAVAQQASDCHFCCKKVYLMEQLTAEGLLFHRGCFRCEYCGTTLRLNNYAFDRDGRYGSRFVCINHFGIPGYIRGARARRKSEDLKAAAAEETAFTEHLAVPSAEDQADAIPTIGVTPERVGFENLAGSDEEGLVARPASGLAEMDEEAWTDHNFRISCDSSDDQSDSATDSDDEDAEPFEEAIDDDDALSVEGTRQLAESWKQRYSRQSASEFSDEAESSEWSCERDDAEDEDDSSTATEGDAVARELLRQKERLLERAKRRREEDSEGGSDCTSTETESDDEDEQEEENLATEIETDSEFELDSSLPTILIDSDLQVCQVKSGRIERGNLNKPAPNKYLQKNNAKNNNRAAAAAPIELTQVALRHRPTQLELQAKEKMVPLQQVKSTEGIASKTSLELKKKYLLGGEAAAGAFGRQVLKSDSASALDSRFRSFVSQISEQQKLLQPAAQPSPAMQSLLLDSNKATSASPLLTSMSSGNLLNNRADLLNKLPKVPSSFVHICGRKSEERLDDDKTPLVENMHILASSEAEEKERKLDRDTDRESDKISDLEREKPDEDATPQAEHRDIVLETKDISDEPRPRSPAHETSIIVPDASEWRAAQQQQLQQGESESESSESSSSSSESGSITETEEVEEAPLVVPPRVEITEVGDKELETELSDWAHEENSLDVDVEIEARNVTLRKPKRMATLAQEDNDDDLGDHVDVLTVSESNEEKQQLVLTPVDDIVEAVNLECQIAPLASAPEPPVESEKVEEEEQPPPPPPPMQVEEENGPVDVMSVSVSSLGEGINDINFVDTSEDEEDGEESSVKIEEYQPLAQASSSTNTESKTPDTESKSPDTEQERLLQEDEKASGGGSAPRARLAHHGFHRPRCPAACTTSPVPMPPSGRPVSVLLTGVRLPETPLTHPEAFSCPDIRQALLAEAAVSTPVAPPRAKKKPQAQTEPIKGGGKQGRERRKSIMQAMSELFRKSPAADKEKKGPPVPPPPAHYPPASPPAQEDSPSDGEDSRSFSVEDSVRRSARSAKKAARQAQLKRLRTAHELKRQLEELEVKQRQLEQRGVALEKALKGEAAVPHANEADMLHEWFALMRQLAEARRHERQLTIKAQELELHERHARLQSDLRQRMAVDVEHKSSRDVEEEGKILSEILEIVEQRNGLTNQLEEDRQRYAEEDKELEAQMLAKGLRLTPLRKESNV